MLNQTEKLVEKLIDGTLSKVYLWHKATPLPIEVSANYPVKSYGMIEPYKSYWFKNQDNLIVLLSINNNTHSIFLYSFKTGEFSEYPISIQSYFRLRTVIQNQLGLSDKMLNDFLNS